MDKLKFWVFCLVSALVVQHVQVENIKNRERENWRQFRVIMDAQDAHAVLPIALAAAAPYVLASLVAGTTAVWCYTHGGKEAWIQFTGAVNDGVAVTKAWIQEKIAQNNGIDTSGETGLSADGTKFIADGTQYGGIEKVGWVPHWSTAGYIFDGTNYGGWTYLDIRTGAAAEPGRSFYDRYKVFFSNITAAPDSFDPANHPELYTGPALLSNCHNVAKQYPNLSLVYPPATASPPPVYDPNKKIQVPVAARLADGSLVDQAGRKLPPPPAGVVPNLIDPPLLDPDTPTIPIETPAADLPNYVNPDMVDQDLKDFFAPVDLANQLGQLGITGPINGIRDIGGVKHLVWKDAAGVTHATPVSTAIAAQVAPMLPAAAVTSGTGSMVDPTKAEKDPGNPADIPLPELPAFDTEWAWGEELAWDWEAWISKIPFLSVLSGARIQLSGASSTIQFPITVYDQSKTVSFDFADYDTIWHAMGLVIYAVACWWALQLALLKNG